MKFCHNCGEELENEAKFCNSCGARQDVTNVGGNDFPNNQSQPISSGAVFPVIGWISAVISVLFIPILFGGIGIVMGVMYRKYQKTHGTVLIVVSIILALIGVIFGAIVGAFNSYY